MVDYSVNLDVCECVCNMFIGFLSKSAGQEVLTLGVCDNPCGLQSWPTSNIGTRSSTLAWGWPLQLRHARNKSYASQVILRNYCNKRHSPNISLGLRKLAGALLAYMVLLSEQENAYHKEMPKAKTKAKTNAFL